jgi:hypothetical protein
MYLPSRPVIAPRHRSRASLSFRAALLNFHREDLMRQQDTPMEVAIKGAVAGLAGTTILTLAMQSASRLLGSPQASSGSASSVREGERATPTGRLVAKVASGIFERELPVEVQNALGRGVHWGYGALWGTIYGIVQASIRLPLPLHGTILGFIVWLVGPLGLVPAMKLTETPSDQPPPPRIRSLFFHEIYGWTVALAFALLSRRH